MRQLSAFTAKEFMEMVRTKKLLIMTLIFLMFGILSPAIAKITPWLFETMSDSLADQGLSITAVDVTALTSWQQFYKNITLVLLIAVAMTCGILVKEYQKGTLINMVTKGLTRWKVIVSKTLAMVGVWTWSYWLCFFVTYGYNQYFWGNEDVRHLFTAGAMIYIFGIWIMSVVMAISTIVDNYGGVLVGTILCFGAIYLVSIVPNLADYLPVKLLSAVGLVDDSLETSEFIKGIIITGILIIINMVGSVLTFNRKRL